MRNARVITVTERNINSGNVSLQKSDLNDFIDGKLRLLIVHDEGTDMADATWYEGEDLNTLMASAVQRGPLYNKESGESYFLANR